MRFDVAGPFEISRHGKKKNITKESIEDLKSKMEAYEEGLSEACGCYVFAKSVSGSIVPWYVGQACRRPLIKEALNADNITKYNKALDDKGRPLLFAIPARTPNGKLRKRPTKKESPPITFLESWLIAAALDRNPSLINNKKTKFLREVHVVGVFNPKQGESTEASRKLKRTLWQ